MLEQYKDHQFANPQHLSSYCRKDNQLEINSMLNLPRERRISWAMAEMSSTQ